MRALDGKNAHMLNNVIDALKDLMGTQNERKFFVNETTSVHKIGQFLLETVNKMEIFAMNQFAIYFCPWKSPMMANR